MAQPASLGRGKPTSHFGTHCLQNAKLNTANSAERTGNTVSSNSKNELRVSVAESKTGYRANATFSSLQRNEPAKNPLTPSRVIWLDKTCCGIALIVSAGAIVVGSFVVAYFLD